MILDVLLARNEENYSEHKRKNIEQSRDHEIIIKLNVSVWVDLLEID